MTSLATVPEREGVLANVSAVLISGSDETRTNELARALESLFEDAVVVAEAPADEHPGRGALGELVRALCAAREARVLIVAANAPRPAIEGR